MSGMKIKHTAVASGAGRLKASDLVEAGNALPGEAVVTVTVRSDQRDGYSWTISAEWDDVAQANMNAPLKRDTGDYFGR